MPFIKPADREKFEDLDYYHSTELASTPGERCYVHYREMLKVWKKEPRWTTVDLIASWFIPNYQQRAKILAFLVFFFLHAMPYEIKKRQENGEPE